MKPNELVLAKCIKNIDPRNDEMANLEIDKFYVVDEIWIGQSNSSVKIDGKSYNSIMFEYYDSHMKPINIYEKYSPYKNIKKEQSKTPESIKNLSREQLEKFTLDLLHHDHIATHRANDLEDIIEEAIDYMYECLECAYHGGTMTFDRLVHNTEDILSKYKGSDE